MLKLRFGDGEFRRRLVARAGMLRRRYVTTFLTTVGTVYRAAVQSAPKGKWFGGSLRRSAFVDESGSTADVLRADIGFTAPYARLVHDNLSGVTIRPTDKYLYVPLTRKGAKAGQTRDYKGVRMYKDYVLPGFPRGPRPVRLRPQKQAGFLLRHAKYFWPLFHRLLERVA